jgi:hypothetical protein
MSLTLAFSFESIMFFYENLSSIINFKEIINEKFKNEDNETLMHLLVVEELMSLHVKNLKNNSNEFFTKDIKIQTLLTHFIIFCCIENKEKLILILNEQKKILEQQIEGHFPEERMLLLLKYTHVNHMANITMKILEIEFNDLLNDGPTNAFFSMSQGKAVICLEYFNIFSKLSKNNNSSGACPRTPFFSIFFKDGFFKGGQYKLLTECAL